MDLLTWVRHQWDRVLAWIVVAAGAIALVLGWVGVSGTPYSFEQIPYVISGGLGGLFLLGVGAMLWVSADLRDEWRKVDELVRLLREEEEDASASASPAVPRLGSAAAVIDGNQAPRGSGSRDPLAGSVHR
jgi:hypothetical protein